MQIDFELSDHAAKRCQQRGVHRDVVYVLLSYGACVPHGGAERYFMNKRARRRAERAMGHAEYARVVDHLDKYLVASDSTIVTVGNLTKRRWRSKPDRPSKHPGSLRRRLR